MFKFSPIFGSGQVGNDDVSGATINPLPISFFRRSILPLGAPGVPTDINIYFVAITPYNRDPVNGGLLMFPDVGLSTNILLPTPAGLAGDVDGYTGMGFHTGTYTIVMTGAAHVF